MEHLVFFFLFSIPAREIWIFAINQRCPSVATGRSWFPGNQHRLICRANRCCQFDRIRLFNNFIAVWSHVFKYLNFTASLKMIYWKINLFFYCKRKTESCNRSFQKKRKQINSFDNSQFFFFFYRIIIFLVLHLPLNWFK